MNLLDTRRILDQVNLVHGITRGRFQCLDFINDDMMTVCINKLFVQKYCWQILSILVLGVRSCFVRNRRI